MEELVKDAMKMLDDAMAEIKHVYHDTQHELIDGIKFKVEVAMYDLEQLDNHIAECSDGRKDGD